MKGFIFLTKFHGAYLLFENQCNFSLPKDKARLHLVCVYVPPQIVGIMLTLAFAEGIFILFTKKLNLRLFSSMGPTVHRISLLKEPIQTNYTIIHWAQHQLKS